MSLIDEFKGFESLFTDSFEAKLNKTPEGTMFLAGSGPPGTTCRECLFYFFDGRRHASSGKAHGAGEMMNGICAEYKKHMHKKKPFPAKTPTCKYFAPNANPPALVEKPRW